MNLASRPRILIVDDLPTNIKVLSDLLLDYGFEVLIAKDGENALQKLQRVVPDLILLDVLMPGLDGFETCRLLKGSPMTQNIPVIFMTALSDPVDKIKGLMLGAVDYVTKPLQHEEVIARVNVHLKLRILTRQLEEQNALLQEEVRSRKLAETALRSSEEKFSKAFRSNPGPMIITTLADRRFLEANQNFCSITHYAQEEIHGKTVSELNLWVDPEAGDRFFQTLQTEGVVHKQELEIRTQPGEIRTLQVSAEVIQVNDTPCALAMTYDITHCKQAAAALQEKEQFLRSIYEGIGISIFIVDVSESGEFRNAGVNARHEEVTGYGSHDFLGKSYEDLFPADIVAAWYQNYRACIAAGKTILYEEFVPFQGIDHWWLTTLTPLRNSQGRIHQLVGTCLEITDRKKAEAALRKSQSDLATAQRVAHIGSWEYDFIAGKITWSEEKFRIFGRNPSLSEPSVEELLMYYHPDDRLRVKEQIDRAIERGEMLEFEARICRPDGEIRYTRVKGEAIRSEAGQVVGLFGVVLDITDRQQAEAALRQSEARYRAIVQDQTELIMRLQKDGTITFVNDAFCRYFQLTPEAIVGTRFHPEVSEDDRARIAAQLHSLTAECPVKTIDHPVIVDGQVRWTQWINRWIGDDQGNFLEFQSVGRDISDRKQMEAELQNARDVADAANLAKSTFLANMSHELRTPLHAILGFTELLALEENLSEFQTDSLKIINNSGEHLLELINDVLEVSKIEAGKAVVSLSMVDLRGLFKNLEDMLQLRAVAKGLELLFQLADDLPHYVQTDEGKLRQILLNLLGNAIKFTPSGRVTLRAEVRAIVPPRLDSALSHQLIFEVEDTGLGIADDELNTLFDAFTQTEAGRQSQKGTGLGLFISRQLVRLLQGDIAVESRVGQGTCFKCNIAVGLPSAQADAPDQPMRRAIGLQPNHPSLRILVAEDTLANQLLFVQLLSNIGFEVRTAEDGREAIALWNNWNPHLILMDMRMPNMDGYEATRQIKATARGWKTVIIAVTASVLEEERTDILAAGCDDLLCKPFKEQMLLQKLAEYLDVHYVYAE
ncbi:MAG: PAS domain S-box protein [Drouetiella hepatica Uher 2000/2452]|jgi:PAS domain S-box-containing protein|uniref:Circadian input-output histidine kinase CikA n=1 Tax=Drouetiella hepatica Uher 2000/2452 TaxID=904376 RepID=A0A951QGB3_9CYAN|nr:PAS domain S-box protein [Drouetiella hepatica Uher 2000/2452]